MCRVSGADSGEGQKIRDSGSQYKEVAKYIEGKERGRERTGCAQTISAIFLLSRAAWWEGDHVSMRVSYLVRFLHGEQSGGWLPWALWPVSHRRVFFFQAISEDRSSRICAGSLPLGP